MYGEFIKKARKAKNLTQSELGKAIGVSTTAIMRYEKEQREPSFKILLKLANKLDISPFDILRAEWIDQRSNHIKSLGEQIKKERYEKGLTQKELAELSGVSLMTIKNCENNKLIPKYNTIKAIANILNMSVDEFRISEDKTIRIIKEIRNQSLSEYTTDELLAEIKRRCNNGS